jgi:hypothetical protein
MKLTKYELSMLETNPAALRAAADYNDNKESEASAVGDNPSANYHHQRRLDLAAEADWIERRLDAGLSLEMSLAEYRALHLLNKAATQTGRFSGNIWHASNTPKQKEQH